MHCGFFIWHSRARLQCICVPELSLQLQDEHLLDEPMQVETTGPAASLMPETQQSHFPVAQTAGQVPAAHETPSVPAGRSCWTKAIPETGNQPVPTKGTQLVDTKGTQPVPTVGTQPAVNGTQQLQGTKSGTICIEQHQGWTCPIERLV